MMTDVSNEVERGSCAVGVTNWSAHHFVEDTVTRPRTIAPRIGALVAICAALGFGVTVILGGDVNQADSWAVHLTTTLDNGATIRGTGIILTATGEVVTSYDAVHGAVSIAADVSSSALHYAATTFALSPTDDVAVLQLLDATGLPSANIGDSSRVAVGNHLTAIAAATLQGKQPKHSQGAVIALGQAIVASDLDGANAQTLSGMIEFNAPVPDDGAGGPLVDTSGMVVGLDATGAEGERLTPDAPGVGYAIPIDQVMAIDHDVNTRTLNPNIIEGQGAYLGIGVHDSATPPGALIVMVEPGTPASVAGMVPGDVIVSVDGLRVDSMDALREQLQRHRGGDRVVVGWLDAVGHHHSASVQLAAATFA